MFRIAALALLALGALIRPAAAQGAAAPTLPDPEAVGRFRLGPVRFTPSIQITNLGVDDNVFNEAVDPKEDTTAVLGPKAEFWGRLGPRIRLYGSSALDYHYFQTYESQRSFGSTNIARLNLDLGRLQPFVEGAHTRTRVRPGFEIDERARRTEQFGRAGLGVRLFSRTQLLVWGRTAANRFDASEEFLGTNLANALDRDADTIGGGIEVELTPLTTFVVNAEAQTDRFVRSPDRDADTFRITPGFHFKPFALIDGTLLVGYRRFETLSPVVPDFSGVAAAVDLGYTFRRTRVVGRFNRDVTYSFETTEPYYLQTDWSLDLTQRITGRWDLVARGGLYTLDYERLLAPGFSERTDRGRLYGGGIGWRVGEHLRLGLNVDYIERRSDTDVTRSYERYRTGLSVTYGMKQR